MEATNSRKVGGKRFKEYLFESLMIFVAVSMGFIAENFRESLGQAEIEQRYMEMMAANLEEDIMRIESVISNRDLEMKYYDSLINLRGYNLLDTMLLEKFYTYQFKASSTIIYYSNNSTFEAMKHSGMLQLIKNRQLLDSIFQYQKGNWLLNSNIVLNNEYFEKFIDLSTQIVQWDSSSMTSKTKWIKNNDLVLNQFFNTAFIVQFSYETYVKYFLKKQLVSAKNILLLLEKEYNIKAKKK